MSNQPDVLLYLRILMQYCKWNVRHRKLRPKRHEAISNHDRFDTSEVYHMPRRRKYHTSRSICCQRRNRTHDIPNFKSRILCYFQSQRTWKRLIRSQALKIRSEPYYCQHPTHQTVCVKDQPNKPPCVQFGGEKIHEKISITTQC